MQEVTLRPHQEACARALMLCRERKAYAKVSVAGGKSLILARCAEIAQSQTRVVIATHTKELVQQDYKACQQLGINAVICCASLGQVNVFGRVTVGSIQTIARKLEYFKDCRVILIDELHRASPEEATQYQQLMNAAGDNAMIRGVTGTDYRADSTGSLKDSFGPCVYVYSFGDALADGRVKPLRAIPANAEDIDVKGLKISGGEWSGTELRNRGIALAPVHARAALASIIEEGRSRTIVFACDIEHAEILAKEFTLAGRMAIAVHSKTAHRDYWVDEFRAGRLQILISVLAFSTGFDVPDIDSEVLCRPMRSRVLYEQSLGRGARLTPYAIDCVVVDFGGNIVRHGPLDMVKDAKKARKDKDDDDETLEDKTPKLEGEVSDPAMVGRDLRKSASAEHQILAATPMKEIRQWLKVTSLPQRTERGQIIIPSERGSVKWPSRNWQSNAEITHVYAIYEPYKGLMAQAVYDSNGMLWQPV